MISRKRFRNPRDSGSESRFHIWIVWLFLLPIRFYRLFVSPNLKPRCRFYPSCSEYFEIAVRKYGVLRGAGKGMWRILRCNPLGGSGYDPP
ncbi:MAG: membrane protein insertion efficiency factor YidD [Actinomycetota bacterium]|nr:membrane protein insertion efficiency factor YidD [Actinomycetota bacterium]